jgi:hypothetical protein
MLVHACNSSNQEAEAGELSVWGWAGPLKNEVKKVKQNKNKKQTYQMG